MPRYGDHLPDLQVCQLFDFNADYRENNTSFLPFLHILYNNVCKNGR